MENKRDQKRTVTELYNRVAPIYGGVGPNFFKHCGRRMVELAEIFSGAKVLDVACGRGASLFPAAEAIGNHGSIIGIDLASRMLRETKKEIEKEQRHISLNLMDGDELGFSSNAFDFVLCGFAIFFFPHPDLTLQEWNRVLVPAGKLMICVVGESDKHWNWFDELLVSYHELHGFPISPISEGRNLHRPDEIRSLMLDSRFRESHILTEDYELVYADEQQWWNSKWTHGPRFALENMPPEILEQFRLDAWERLASLKEPDGFHERRQVTWVVGMK